MRTSFCLIILSIIVPMGAVADDKHPGLTFKIDRTVARHGFDGDTCWVHARAGVVPANVPGNTTNNPIVVMTMQKLLLSGSDVFYALNGMRKGCTQRNAGAMTNHQQRAGVQMDEKRRVAQ